MKSSAPEATEDQEDHENPDGGCDADEGEEEENPRRLKYAETTDSVWI